MDTGAALAAPPETQPVFEIELGFPPGLATIVAEAAVISELGQDRDAISIRWIEGRTDDGANERAARIVLNGPRAPLIRAALALADQGAFVPLASTRHKGAAQVPNGTNVADGLAFAISRLVDAALYWASQIPTATNGDAVHQMRVAVRRLRSLLSAPRKSVTGTLWQHTKFTLGNLSRALGEARAWDVFLESIGAEMAEAWPNDKRITTLLARAHKRHAAAYAKLRQDLTSDSLRRLHMELALFATLRPFTTEGDETFWTEDCRIFAASALNRRLRKLLAPGDDLTILDPAALHEIRKNAKRLRYSCELFASFWGAKPARKYLEHLGELQDSLGEINDSITLEPLLADLGATGFAAGMAVGIATERARPALKLAQSAWKKLNQADKFWK